MSTASATSSKQLAGSVGGVRGMKPTRRHSVAAITTSQVSSQLSGSGGTTDRGRHLSVPNGHNQYQEPRRNSLVPISEAANDTSQGLKSRRRSVVVVSPPRDDKSPSSTRSSSRRTSVSSRPEATPAVGPDSIPADQLIAALCREVDEAVLTSRRNSLPQASNEFASVMNEMAA